jgi:type 1 glutamine amidotransferase
MRLLVIAMMWAAALPAQAPSNTSKVYGTAKRPRALVLLGDRYHSPVYARDNISKALVRENIPATFIEEVTALNAESLAQHQLLIILRDGMNWPNGYDKPDVKWMTDAQQQAIWDFVNRGGGFLALHNAQGLYPPGGLYYKLFGGDYGGHPEPYTFTVRVENKNHPITAGVEDFEIFDEQHTVKYYLDREHLLLRSIARNNLQSEAGWWREQGQGRFAYLAPGHTPEALGHPMMQRLMRNAMNWLLRLE